MSGNLETWLKNYKAPGRGINTNIDRLCIRAKPYRQNGMEWKDIFHEIYCELEKKSPRNRLEDEEYQHMQSWTEEALKKAYNNRYPPNKTKPKGGK
jgi:hypothetical protein